MSQKWIFPFGYSQVITGNTSEPQDTLKFISSGEADIYKVLELLKVRQRVNNKVTTYLYNKAPAPLLRRLKQTKASERPKMIWREKVCWLVGSVGEGVYFGVGEIHCKILYTQNILVAVPTSHNIFRKIKWKVEGGLKTATGFFFVQFLLEIYFEKYSITLKHQNSHG